MSGQVVQITINVTDANAAEAVQQVVAQLNELGPAGQGAGAVAGAGLDQVGGRAISAREQVRLLSEEMHLGVPRAMQTVIASSQMMSAAIGAIGPAMIGIGGVDILMHIGEAAYGAYQKYFLMKDAIDASNAAITRLGDASEAALNRAADAQERYIRMTQGAKQADTYSLNRFENTPYKIPLYGDQDFSKSPDSMKGDLENITGQSVMPKDLDATIAKLEDYEKQQRGILAIYQQFQAMGDPFHIYTREVDAQGHLLKNVVSVEQFLKNSEAAHMGDAADRALQISKDKSNTPEQQQAIQKEREKQDAILALETSARNAQLSGDALLEAQREEAIDNFVRKYGQSRAALLAIDSEYMEKESSLWKQQSEEADKAMRAAQHAADQQAHTGTGSIQFELEQSLQEIGKRQSNGMQPGYANDLRDAANQTANTKILAAQTEFESQLAQITQRGDDQQIDGYARIAVKADESLKQINAAWTKYEDSVRGAAGLTVDEETAKNAAITAANQNALREMEQLHNRTLEQIGKEEEQTARYSLAEWQQAQLRILDDYQDRVQKIQDLEKQQEAALDADMQAHKANFAADQQAEVMAAQDADAQMLAARQQMNAAIQQSDEETRDRIASGLQSLFQHPEQFFEKRAMDTAFQMMANEMLGAFKSSSATGGILQYLFGMGPQMSTSTNPLTDMQSVLGMGGHRHAGLTSSASTNPAMVQFQQGSTTLLTGSQALISAASSLQSVAATAGGSGGVGIGGRSIGGMAGGGLSLPGMGIAPVSTAMGAGLDTTSMGSSSNPMMLPGIGGAMSGLSTLQTFGNGLALPTMAAGGALSADSSAAGGLMGGAAAGSGAAASGASAMSAGMGIASGGLMAAGSIFSAYQNSNPLAGLMGGAMGGMEIGATIGSFFGPGIGTVVGGAIGAIAGGVGGLLAGIFGDQGRSQAEALDVNQIQPALAKDVQDFEAGRAGYNTAAPQLNAMLISAQNATNSMGSGARAYFNSTIQPEIQTVLTSLQKQEIGGRSAITLSAAQFHSGGWTGDFGDLATSDTEGFIHAMQNEFVVNPMAAAAHAPILQAMNNGTNFAYAGSVQPRMPASSGGSSGPQITVQALDSKSVAQWAKAGGGLALMAALNQAQRQYSGVGRG